MYLIEAEVGVYHQRGPVLKETLESIQGSLWSQTLRATLNDALAYLREGALSAWLDYMRQRGNTYQVCDRNAV